MLRRIQRRHDGHAGEPVGPVLVVLPPLVQHHFALVGELGVRQRRQQVAHAVGLHPQREIQRVRRNHFPVIGAVRVRGSVQRGARFLQRVKVPAVVMLRALEHQVFEEVGEPGASGDFVLGSDVIPDVDRDNGKGVILVNQDVEAIGQRVLAERNVHGYQATIARSRRRSAPPRRRPVTGSIPAATTPVEMPNGLRMSSSWPRAFSSSTTAGASVDSTSSTPGWER